VLVVLAVRRPRVPQASSCVRRHLLKRRRPVQRAERRPCAMLRVASTRQPVASNEMWTARPLISREFVRRAWQLYASTRAVCETVRRNAAAVSPAQAAASCSPPASFVMSPPAYAPMAVPKAVCCHAPLPRCLFCAYRAPSLRRC